MLSQVQTCSACPHYERRAPTGPPPGGAGGPYCRLVGAPIRFDAPFPCPVGPWTLTAEYRRSPSDPVSVPIRPSHQMKARSFWESLVALPGQAVQMAQVVTSGTAPDDVIAMRGASCLACPARKVVGDDAYCGDCGCGVRPWAKLDSKLTYAYLPCPRQQPGFS